MDKKYLKVIERKGSSICVKSCDKTNIATYEYKGYSLEMYCETVSMTCNFNRIVILCHKEIVGCERSISDTVTLMVKARMNDNIMLHDFLNQFLVIENLWNTMKIKFKDMVESGIENELANEERYKQILGFTVDDAKDIFDDWARDENGLWSQVCEECKAKMDKDWKITESAPVDLICGVKGCNNTATYYVELGE